MYTLPGSRQRYILIPVTSPLPVTGQSVLSAGITTLFVSGNSVQFANDKADLNGVTFTPSAFNGPIIYDLTNATAFSGWGVLAATAAYTSTYLTGGGVGVSFAGQTYVAGTSVTIGGEAVPEPSTWAIMGFGFALLGLGCRARRSATAPA